MPNPKVTAAERQALEDRILAARGILLDPEEVAARLEEEGVRRTDGRRLTATDVHLAVRNEEMRALVHQGVSRKEVASRFGVTIKTVDRAQRAKLTFRPLTDSDRQRIEILAKEGMPAAFIAQDLGRNPSHISKFVRTHVERPEDSVRDWLRTWSYITHRPELLELHYEIFPKHRAAKAA